MFFFFFQAEDGIRDYKVTGVQSCALPIWSAQCGTASAARTRAAGISFFIPVAMPETSPELPATWIVFSVSASLLSWTWAGPSFQVSYCWRQETGGAADSVGLRPGEVAWPLQAAARKPVTASERTIRKVIRSIRVLLTATKIANPIRDVSSSVPQIPSGTPRTRTRHTAHAPASAVRNQQPVKATQYGPIKTKPLRTSRRPVHASATAATDDNAMPSCHSRTADGADNAHMLRQRRLNAGETMRGQYRKHQHARPQLSQPLSHQSSALTRRGARWICAGALPCAACRRCAAGDAPVCPGRRETRDGQR